MTARQRRLRRMSVSALAFVLLTTACGLKTETYDQLRASGGTGAVGVGGDGLGTGTDGTGGTGTDGTGGTGTGGTGTGGTGTGTGGTGTGGTGTGGTGGTGTGPGAGPGTGPGSAPGTGPGTGPGSGPGTGQPPIGPGTKIGVTDSEIKIGIHAPLSGASPLPQASFDRGAKLYWQGKKIFGRNVTVEVLDDTYKPSGAVRVCQEMARRDFIVIGGAGADQIQACARDRTLQRAHTPYLSAGVTENQLGTIPTYFALSLTYREQAPLVVKMAESQGFLNKGKWALVLSNTPNFDDARQSMEAALKAKGVPYDVHLVPKAGSDSDALNLSNKLRGNYPVIYFLGQPTFFLKVVRQTQNAAYKPIWTGVGISMGLNTIAQVACDSTADAGGYDGRFLSPYPGLDRAPKAFFDAGGKDDIELTLFGLSQLLEQALLRTGGNLTRENFTRALASSALQGGTYPSVRYSPNDHFGGTAAYMLKSDCSKKQYVTAGGPIS